MARFTLPFSKLRCRLPAKILIPALFFILAICLSVNTTYYATEHYLDGDASSELVLAHHLAETGQLLSSDWYYSTELRVLNTQLVYTPLFHLFSDWHMVRFVGALIMQALLVLSFAYLCRQSSLSLGAFFLGAAMLISPTSIAYGRIVLYHCYYMPHIILSFLIVGLYLSTIRAYEQKCPFSFIIHFILLLIISLLSGLGGIRQPVITHIPLCVLILFLIFHSKTDTPIIPTIFKNRMYLISSICALMFALLGMGINMSILSQHFQFRDNNMLSFEVIDSSGISLLLYSILNLFGFQKSSSLFTVAGIATLGSMCIAIYFFYFSFKRLFQNRDAIQNHAINIISFFCISSLSILLIIFIAAGSGLVSQYNLYLIPSIVWVVPFLCIQYDEAHFRLSSLRLPDFFLICVLLFFIPTIGTNLRFFAPHPNSYILRYEGLPFKNDKLVQELEDCTQLLCEQGYSQGYSTFWNANTLTEMTDGQIKMIGLELNVDTDPADEKEILPSFSYYKWLTLKSYLDIKPEKVFLLLTSAENKDYQKMPFEDKGEIIYEDDGKFIIYGFDDPFTLYQMIEW